jgi:phosphatidylglycerophosphate synthase
MNTSTRDAKGQSPWNLPNTLTWLRILMIPAILALFYLLPYPWADPAACAAFALAGITDSLDGYYARKLGQTSRLGAFLDPVADKLIVAAALVLIVSKDPRWFVVIGAVVIIGREIAVSALREWMADQGVDTGQVQNHHANRRLIVPAVPSRSARYPDLQSWPSPDADRRRAHPVVDGSIPAPRVAGTARQRGVIGELRGL